MDDELANVVIAQLLFLEADDAERDVSLYVNSPGRRHHGPVRDLRHDAGDPARRRDVVHRPGRERRGRRAGGRRGGQAPRAAERSRAAAPAVGQHRQGQSIDIKIRAEEMVRQRRLMEEILAKHTGQTIERIHEDLDRDFILGPEEAKAYGAIDHVG